MTLRAYFTDIGGCLCKDTLDDVSTCLLSRFCPSQDRLEKAKHALWNHYAYMSAKKQCCDDAAEQMEKLAWAEFAAVAGIDASPEELVGFASECGRPLDPRYGALFQRLHDDGVVLGVLSNNTAFFWPRQRDALGIEALFPSERVILSCDYGVSKRSEKLELFSAAVKAAGVPAQNCAFADDRQHNVERALQADFGMAILHPKNVDWGSEYVGRILTRAGWLSADFR